MDCPHTRQEIRYRLTSDNRRMYAHQCMTCGSKIGNWIPHHQIDPQSNVEPFDDTLQEQARENARYVYQMARDEHRAEQKQEFDQWYRGYLLSPVWRTKRRLVLNRCNGWCEGCASAQATEVHHLSYANVGDELLYELVGLCENCHRKAHSQNNK